MTMRERVSERYYFVAQKAAGGDEVGPQHNRDQEEKSLTAYELVPNKKS
jgi:hypothetical protein